MKQRVKYSIQFLVSFPFAIIGGSWLLHYSFLSPSFLLGVVCIILGFISTFLIKKKSINTALVLSGIAYAYLIGEGITYGFHPFKGESGFNEKCAVFDHVRGYRLTKDSIRVFRSGGGKMIYDNVFYPNNKGWLMHQDYNYPKADSSTKRWMILGDSFIAGIMLKDNLPNRVQKTVNDSLGSGKIELYSFGIDGGGLMNWYSIFFKELVPRYDFDGLIIAPFEDNIYRDFMIMEVQNESFIGRIKKFEWEADESFRKEQFNTLRSQRLLYSDMEINELDTKRLIPFNWPLKNRLERLISKKALQKKSNRLDRSSVRDILSLQDEMGQQKYKLLDKILEWCQNNNKDVLLASIPSKFELMNQLSGKRNQHRVEMNIIADHYKLKHFDGYTVFEGLNEDEINTYWFKVDGHWNQKGSDRYSKLLSEYLIQDYIQSLANH